MKGLTGQSPWNFLRRIIVLEGKIHSHILLNVSKAIVNNAGLLCPPRWQWGLAEILELKSMENHE
jgi:hypothetical protein